MSRWVRLKVSVFIKQYKANEAPQRLGTININVRKGLISHLIKLFFISQIILVLLTNLLNSCALLKLDGK